MRALVFHFSSLVGLLVLLNQLWGAAELERTLFTAFVAGLVMYTVLIIGFAAARRIMNAMPPVGTAKAASKPDAGQAGSNELFPLNRAEEPTA